MRPILAALRTTVVGRRERIEDFGVSARGDDGGGGDGHEPATRRVWFNGGWMETPVLARDALRAGDAIPGPAIVEQLDTTTIVEPGDTARVDRHGNLLIAVARPT